MVAVDTDKYEMGAVNGSNETMLLSGHQGAVYSLVFDPTGSKLASASYDRCVFLWETEGDCTNYNVLKGHKNAVTQVRWCTDRSTLVTGSADETCMTWDANKGEMNRKFVAHTGIVNSVDSATDAPDVFVSGSDDRSVLVWDSRNNAGPVHRFEERYQVTVVTVSADGQHVYSGGIDGVVRRYDVRVGSLEPDLQLVGCTNIVTGLSLSPDGGRLLVNAMDSALRSFDVRPFCARGEDHRLEQTFQGVHHGAEKTLLRAAWSADGERVTCGSADRNVHVWDSASAEEVHLLGGHKASVNDVVFHPAKQNVIASGGSDKQIFLGPLS